MDDENGTQYLNDDEVKALLNAAANARDTAIIQLFLCAGLHLIEVPELNINSIDREKKILHVGGEYARDIPINDELFGALTAWSQERIDNPSEALFVTHRRIQRLTPRGLGKLLEARGRDAGIKRIVNSRLLRNTFGVRLFSKDISIDNAAAILGISDTKAISRFIKAAKEKKEGRVQPDELEKLDTRPRFIKKISKLARPLYKVGRVIAPPAPADKTEITVGRDSEISRIKQNISREVPTLLTGPIGIGKTHLLKLIAQEMGVLYIDSISPIKPFLQKLCDKYCPDWQQRLPSKGHASAKEIADLLISTLNGSEKKDILLIDNLDSIRTSDAEILFTLFDCFIIIAAADSTPDRLKELWWKFRIIGLQPLDREASKELIKHLTQGLTVVDYELLETKILTVSNGVPLAIVAMVGQISHLPVVTKDDCRGIYHEAGVRYRDWTAFVIILWSVATSSRFLNLGAQSFEGYILAVLGMAALAGGIRFLRSR